MKMIFLRSLPHTVSASVSTLAYREFEPNVQIVRNVFCSVCKFSFARQSSDAETVWGRLRRPRCGRNAKRQKELHKN